MLANCSYVCFKKNVISRMKSFEFRPAAEKVISFEYNYSLTMVAILLKALRLSKGHMKNIYGFSRWSSLFY